MNLQMLTDDQLHDDNIRGAREEREILTKMLHHLRETERRRLFSKYKCQSLFDYAVRYLQYSPDQADRRIKAMRLLKDIPQIEEKINSGAINLTNLALAQKLFQTEKKAGTPIPTEQKTQILNQLENQTTRQAEKIVFAISPEMKTKKNELGFHNIEDEALREKLLKVKGLLAHSHPNISLTELLHFLADGALHAKAKSPFWAPKVTSSEKRISNAEIKRQVWQRDNGMCTNCGSHHAIQEEHIVPKAMGGDYSLKNIKLLCRSCNQRSAINCYGIRKMSRYLKSPAKRWEVPESHQMHLRA